jgi:hypothetical protein
MAHFNTISRLHMEHDIAFVLENVWPYVNCDDVVIFYNNIPPLRNTIRNFFRRKGYNCLIIFLERRLTNTGRKNIDLNAFNSYFFPLYILAKRYIYDDIIHQVIRFSDIQLFELLQRKEPVMWGKYVTYRYCNSIEAYRWIAEHTNLVATPQNVKHMLKSRYRQKCYMCIWCNHKTDIPRKERNLIIHAMMQHISQTKAKNKRITSKLLLVDIAEHEDLDLLHKISEIPQLNRNVAFWRQAMIVFSAGHCSVDLMMYAHNHDQKWAQDEQTVAVVKKQVEYCQQPENSISRADVLDVI